MATLEVKLMCLWVNRRPGGESSFLLWRELGLNSVRDGLRYLVLQREDILEVAIVTFSPYVSIGGRVDELRGDSDLPSRAQHASLDDPIHAQLSSDLGQGLVGTFVAHG